MIVCKACGKENQDHYKFCLGCGAELTRPEQPQEQNMGMMKTMMADMSHGDQGAQGGATPTPPGGAKLPGMPSAPGGGQPPAGGPPQGGPPPGGPPPAAPPQGGQAGAPTGPPPGVPTGSTQTPGPPQGPPPEQPPPAQPPPGSQAAGGFGSTPGTTPGGGGFGQAPGTTPGTSGMSPAPAGERACPSCGTQVPAAFKFCGACGHKMEEAPAPAAPPRSTADYPQADTQPRATLTLIRPDGSEGGVHSIDEGETTIGREHGQMFENDGYLSPTHAELILNAAGAVIRDLDSLNGVFVKMTDEEQIDDGQVLRIGQELLRFDFIEPPEPLEDGTEVMGSPNPGYWGKLTVVIGEEVDGSAYPLLGDSVTLGRERGDINFPDDGYVSGLHARLATRDGKVYLADLGSSNGTFIKVQGERQLQDGSFVLLGQQLFRLNMPG